MKEILKSDWNYILYDDGGEFLLSVICGSVALFDRNIHLNATEKISFKIDGASYIEKLVQEIRNDPSRYESRHVKI